MKSHMITLKKTIRLSIILLVLTVTAAICSGYGVFAAAEDQKATDIISRCELKASRFSSEYSSLWNDKTSGVFSVYGDGQQYLNVDLKGNEARGIYIKWAKKVYIWRLEATLSDGQVVSSEHGKYGFLQEYTELPKGTVSFRMVTDDGTNRPLEMVEMEVFTPGVLPDRVHIWQPTPSTAEIMMIATHQDDEVLYFGGAIPYYAAERGYDTIIAYTAHASAVRQHEALEGLWTCGVRQHPIFMFYPDKYCTTLNKARRIWSEQDVTRDLTELLVRYRPQVVISQDINGEYGHGQHLITVHCLRNALELAQDAEYISGSLPAYQPWSVSKCYLHLYWNNRIVMQWGQIKLESAGGKTALQVARDAYKCHVSQHKFGYEVGTTEETFDCRRFGLYRTTVGEDVSKDDFFENIELRYIDAEPKEELPGWLQRTGLRGWHYGVTDERWQGSGYLRYCTVRAEEGWYEADETGSLTEPVTRVDLIIDDTSLDMSEYDTLTRISDDPQVFSYSNGIIVRDIIVRYGTVGDESEPAFFVAENAGGILKKPLESIHVSQHGIGSIRLPQLTLKDKFSLTDGQTAIMIICCLLVLAALALSVSVIRLIAANRRAGYRRQRQYRRSGRRY